MRLRVVRRPGFVPAEFSGEPLRLANVERIPVARSERDRWTEGVLKARHEFDPRRELTQLRHHMGWLRNEIGVRKTVRYPLLEQELRRSLLDERRLAVEILAPQR